MQKACPLPPCDFLGLTSVPTAGDMFEVVKDEKVAKTIAAERHRALRRSRLRRRPGAPLSLNDLYARFRPAR